MTPEEWQKVRPILESALELDCANRPAFLNEACADPSLRLEIESLIDAHEQADTRVLNSLPVSGSGIAIEGTDDAMIGRHLGVYELAKRIGQGGMAAVFLAYRSDGEFHRQVAIKLVLPGLDSNEVVNRFRKERQTLAGLDHPNIVKLLDGGSTTEGLPYLVLDYVDGSPIDEYCDSHKLSIEQRLRLFGKVCEALQHALVNQVWLDFSGQTLDFVRSHPEAWMTAVHPEDREAALRAFWGGVRSGQGFAMETRSLRDRDGTYRWHLNQAVVLRDAEGKVLKFVGTTTDIDDQKRAEEKIRQSEKEARQLLDLSPLHIAELGPDGARLYTNRASLDYYGITLEEWQKADLQQVLHPQDAEFVKKDLPGKLQSGSPFEYEVRLKRKDGRYRWFHYRFLSPMSDEEGHTTRWYTAGTDINDRKLAEQRLQEENVALREEIDKASMFEEIVGTSAPLKKALSDISKVAPTDSSVLITGETGTGKELVARAIHRRSQRSSHPFVSVNCAVIPRDLIASELFGHERGAFTGATQRRLGRFELAEKGTIFLDEVGELPAETQIALLRVLQEGEFERIGGTGTIRADVRVIAATNRDLESAIADGTFRSDLFFRLNVFPIELPPLRKRREDIPLLVSYFLNRYARKTGRHFTAVDKKSMDLLEAYTWPGNIRELQNVIERFVIVSETQTFLVDESWLSRQPSPNEVNIQPSLFNRLPAQEKAVIEAALRECGGRVYGPSGAAAKLGVPRTTLESKIKSLKINKNRFKD